MEVPEITGKHLDQWTEDFGSILKLIGQVNARVQILSDLIERFCKKDCCKYQVMQTFNRCKTFGDVIVSLQTMFPKFDSEPTTREEILKLQSPPDEPTTSRLSQLLGNINYRAGRLTPCTYEADKFLLW